MPAVEVEAAQLGVVVAQPVVDVHGRSRRQRGEDEAGPLLARQRGEAHGRSVDGAERLLAVHAGKPTLLVVDPAVVRAGEAAGLAASWRLDDGAAMAAGVEEGTRPAVTVAGEQDGDAQHVERLVRVRFPKLAGQSQLQRPAAE